MSSLIEYPFLKPTFWSYTLATLDSEIHKNLIIKQILNQGNTRALEWLRDTYTPADIQVVIKNSMVSEWTKKSLSLWSKMYGVVPNRKRRFT